MKFNCLTTINNFDSANGGPTRSVTGLSNAMLTCAKSDITIQFFVTNNKADYAVNSAGLKATGSDHFPIFSKNQLLGTIAELKAKHENVIIHNHGVWLPINHIAACCARKYKVPFIITPRGILEPRAIEYKKWKKKIAWLLYQHRDLKSATVLHATAFQEADNLRKLGLKKPIAIIPNGVNVPQQAKCYDPEKKVKTALFLSRIHPLKGLINLVEAWAQVRPKDWKMVIAGPDSENHRAQVEKEILRYGLSEEFELIGSVSDEKKWDIYQDADIFIQPSISENFSIVIAEAMATGLPVITTQGTPWKELEEFNCGWWIKVGVEPLVESLKEALSMPTEALQDMGKRGRALIEKRYSWAGIAQEMETVYHWCLHGGNIPDCIRLD